MPNVTAESYLNSRQLTIFPPFASIVVCSLVCLWIMAAYNANDIDSDQTSSHGVVPSGSIVFALHDRMFWNIFECIQQTK